MYTVQFKPPFRKGGLTSSNLEIRVEMKYFSRKAGVGRKGDPLLCHEFFLKKSNNIKMLSNFFKFSKSFSLAEPKIHMFNLHIGFSYIIIAKSIFVFFMNNLHVL